MVKKKLKLIDSFKTITESGKIVTIFVHQEFFITGEFTDGGIPQETPGNEKLSSSIGGYLNMINENQYEILSSKLDPVGKIIVNRVLPH